MEHRNSNSNQPVARVALITVTALLAILATSIAAAAEEGEYKPPSGGVYSMEAHLKWCAEAKTDAARIKKYEQFWADQSPKESDGYDDEMPPPAGATLRLSALYAEIGQKKDCIEMLKFLEKEDEAFKVEREG